MKKDIRNIDNLSRVEIERQQIEKALEYGISRPEGVKALPDQILSYVLLNRRPFHHATLESASAEKYFLQAALGRRVRILKVWNIGREQIKSDMSLLRGMLSEADDWDPAFEALDRVLKGAGF